MGIDQACLADVLGVQIGNDRERYRQLAQEAWKQGEMKLAGLALVAVQLFEQLEPMAREIRTSPVATMKEKKKDQPKRGRPRKMAVQAELPTSNGKPAGYEEVPR